MTQKILILDLLNQKQIKQFRLEQLIYGSIEIRESHNKKYIYVHTKEDGVQVTKYVGEYTEILYNYTLGNNEEAKIIKKDIRSIEKKLRQLDYIDEDLTEEVAINIDFAHKYLIDTIYNQAILEGITTTLPDTENLIENGIVNNMKFEDTLKIINLKHAWEFILNKHVITSKTDYSVLCMVNKLVEEGFHYTAGMIRSIPVKISGTTWVPPLPIESEIKEDILKITSSKKSNLDKSIDLLLYVVRKQMFTDGNKRTSVIFANHYLISKGLGLIVIPVDKIEKYKKLLIEYYESNNKKNIFEFLKNECYLSIKGNKPSKELKDALKELDYMEKHKEKYKTYNDVDELFIDITKEN